MAFSIARSVQLAHCITAIFFKKIFEFFSKHDFADRITADYLQIYFLYRKRIVIAVPLLQAIEPCICDGGRTSEVDRFRGKFDECISNDCRPVRVCKKMLKKTRMRFHDVQKANRLIFHSRVWPYHSSGDRKTFVTGIFCSIIFIHKITIERLVGDTTCTDKFCHFDRR